MTRGEGSVKVVCRLLVQEKDDVAAMEWVFAVFSKEGEASIAKWWRCPRCSPAIRVAMRV